MLAFLFGLAGVVYLNFLYQKFPFFTKETHESLKTYVLYWFAAAFIIQQFIPFLKGRIEGDLFVRTFIGQKDLEHMAEYIDGSDSVIIVSGDFSFIDTNPKLERCLRNLAFARKLKFVSYKPKEIVEEEMASKTSSNDILLKLKDENSIWFDFPVKAKITIVERGGNKRMLFRFSKDIEGRPVLHMGFIKQTENTSDLLKVIEQLVLTLGEKKAA